MPDTRAALGRVVGLPGAVLLGLGSIVGTGVFVSLGLGAGAAGPAVIVAVAIAAAVATCNGLSSAQLAAAYPVSGGTYEYGYRTLSPALGFTAGWTFLCAKTASAATAALGVGGYLVRGLGGGRAATAAIAVAAALGVTALVAGGLRRSNRANAAIVAIALIALLGFAVAGLPAIDGGHFHPFFARPGGLPEATALAFVAFTGYGRIATLGEEVRDPARTIPRAIAITLGLSLALYVAVVAVAVGVLGAAPLAAAARAGAAPLELAAAKTGVPGLSPLIAVGAVAAMLGVLVNLLLGLSRVVLAMARRGDLPRALARVRGEGAAATPRRAVIAVGAAVAALAAVGRVETTWSFSAFTVLVYYALTNAAALRLPAAQRRFPRAIAAVGLVACLGLAFWVEPAVWLTGAALIAAGLALHRIARRRRAAP